MIPLLSLVVEHAQHAVVVHSDERKWPWLLTRLSELTAPPSAAEAGTGCGAKLIVFVATKAGCAALCARLNASLAHARGGAAGGSAPSGANGT